MFSFSKGAVAALGFIAAVMTASAASANVLYSNGPIDGTQNAWGMSFGQAEANSFILSSAATVTGVDFGAWVNAGDTLLSVDWGITSVQGDYSVDGTAAVVEGAIVANPFIYDVRQDVFSVGSLNLGAGTYYLVLQNAVTASGNPGYWDVNNGPSAAFLNVVGSVQDDLFPGSNSSAFDILGTSGGAPEPAGWALMIGGFGLTGAALRRRTIVPA